MIESLLGWLESRWRSWPIPAPAGPLRFLQANRPDDPDVFDLLVFDGSPGPRVRVSVGTEDRRLTAAAIRGLRDLASGPGRGQDHELLDAGDVDGLSLVVEQASAGANLLSEVPAGPVPADSLAVAVEWLARIHRQVPEGNGFLQVGGLRAGRLARTPRGLRVIDWSRFGASSQARLDCIDLLCAAGATPGGVLSATATECLRRHGALLGLDHGEIGPELLRDLT